MAPRDLFWSEYLRLSDNESTMIRLLAWLERTSDRNMPSVQARALIVLLSLALTTTVHLLRDRVTRALMSLGRQHPKDLFEETIKNLAFADPYVSERALAACYGATMADWASPESVSLRSSLPGFAATLVDKMFVPGAPHGTTHTLTRGYAIGIIAAARRIDSACISARKVKYLTPPFRSIARLFPAAATIVDTDTCPEESALHSDFSNYILGAMIPHRNNYDAENPAFKDVRKQVLWRMKNLGYTTAAFESVDRIIGHAGWQREQSDLGRVDRYGKKYSWIAYFEMYGQREDSAQLPDHRRDLPRTYNADVDPSFPEEPMIWRPSSVRSWRTHQLHLANGSRMDRHPTTEDFFIGRAWMPRKETGCCSRIRRGGLTSRWPSSFHLPPRTVSRGESDSATCKGILRRRPSKQPCDPRPAGRESCLRR